MSIFAYTRVSSKSQDLTMQRAAIEKLAAARGDTIDVWHSEKRTGKVLARPELDRLRANVRAGNVQKLYLFRLDRLSRSGIRDTFEVVEELRVHRVEVVLVSDGFAVDGPAADVVLAVMAWAAKMERLAINERIAAARDRLEAEGKAWGRPPRLTASERDRARALRAQGRSLRQIAVVMKTPKSTVVRALAQA